MASLTLKDIPEDLRAQLENEAAANFRSLTQEAGDSLCDKFISRQADFNQFAIRIQPQVPCILTKKLCDDSSANDQNGERNAKRNSISRHNRAPSDAYTA